MIGIRTMTFADIPAGLSLCRQAGWNQLERDWALFLTLNPEGCRVAYDKSGKVVGTVTTLPYQDHFTWIGMVLVDPEHRRQGIGTQLLNEALQITRNDNTVKLDATPAGREVYLKLNFVDEYRIYRMYLNIPHGSTLPVTTARPAHASDFPAIIKIDLEVFGADRRPVLESNFKSAPQYAFVVEEHDEIKSYCLGRSGYNYDHIGPIVGEDTSIAIQLLAAALGHRGEKPMVMDVLDHTPEWRNFVSSIGFVVLRPLLRMYRGANDHPGTPEKQFAILGPEFG
jgi:GNAT superfamily N-acetyltransferase